jgi:uncharacterized protein (TIGR03435 family)
MEETNLRSVIFCWTPVKRPTEKPQPASKKEPARKNFSALKALNSVSQKTLFLRLFAISSALLPALIKAPNGKSLRKLATLSLARPKMEISSMLSFFRTGLLLTLINTAQSGAQTPAPTPAPAPAFDVASVKPDKTGGMGVRIMFQPGGRFTADNITLKFLIRLAYDVQDFQISGGPPWLNSDRYDIEAKAEGPPESEMRNMTEEQRQADMKRRRLMIQALLADRFKLTLHKESKEAPIYALVVAKNGPKMKELPPEPPPAPNADPKDPPDKPDPKHMGRGGMRMGRGELTGSGVKLSFLAEALSNPLGRTVIDKTGLKGDYDFELKWTPDESQGAGFKPPGDAPPPPDPNGPSIFTAIQEQLGLKLESQKGPVDLLVIDHAEKASEN